MKIAGICAYSRTLNTGMLTVDLALLSVIEEVFGRDGALVELFNVVTPGICGSAGSLQLTYKVLTDPSEQLDRYDAIILWGDFLHSRTYHSGVRSQLRQLTESVDETEIMAHIERGLLLSEVPDSYLERVICFGGNLHLNSYHHEEDVRYRELLRRLYRGAKLVLTRDPISALYAQRYCGLPEVSHAGVDPAFLLDFDNLVTMADFDSGREQADRELSKAGLRIGYSFGRGLAKADETRAVLMGFVEGTAEGLKTRDIVNIRWLRANHEDPIGEVRRKVQLIRSCDLVVTDIYHCAVNALREGVPVICIGRGGEHPQGTRSEKKKEILYYMFNLKDWFVFYEELADAGRWAAARKRCISLIVNRGSTRQRFASVDELVGMARARLTSALRDIQAERREDHRLESRVR